LNKEKVERPPVICPGGMMNAAIVDVMKATGHELPAAHHDDKLMSELAYDVNELTGFENFGIPFCMTVEAEVLGSEINYGTLECEPKIQKEVFPNAASVVFKAPREFDRNNRVNAILNTIHTLSAKYPDTPTIGSLTGPISTAASIVDPMTFLKQLRKDKENSHKLMDYVTDCLIHFAGRMVESGAHVISIADPTATGEILGPKAFEEYAVRYLNQLVDAIHGMGVPAIIHICGKMEAVKPLVAQFHSNALSVDAFVSLRDIMNQFPQVTSMGNLSTVLLEFGEPEKVSNNAEVLLRNQINILAPACGLSTSTPIQNIQAFTQTVKASKPL
jgi:[methyl-Co(III) methanol-specific corrinoid protein]:coenzyme M methyltransferase